MGVGKDKAAEEEEDGKKRVPEMSTYQESKISAIPSMRLPHQP